MTTPTSNLGLSSIQTEFGGSNPISLSEYYRSGSYVPAGQATSATDGVAVPSSGTIRMGMFRGLAKVVTITLTVPTGTAGYNIFAKAGNPSVRANVIVNVASGIVVTGSGGGLNVYGMTTGTGWVSGSTITINNSGTIAGRGGHGGDGGSSAGAGAAGGQGGTALGVIYNAGVTVTVYNYGTLVGGSGGGGGGGSWNYGKSHFGGGGGGGGRPYGVGGLRGTGNGGNGTAGGTGGASSAGTGGAGAQDSVNYTYAGDGGFGGNNLNTAGNAGASSSASGGGGGAKGNYVVGNSYVTWGATGTRTGNAS